MPTKVYWVRHAQSDKGSYDDRVRPLTAEGLADSAEVVRALSDKGITRIFSSPYKRTLQTIGGLSEALGLPVETVEDFRERNAGSWRGENFLHFIEKQWEDHSYRIEDGECLAEVQRRNIAALKKLLSECAGETLAIATHGTALSSIINYFRPEFGFKDFMRIVDYTPYIIEMDFEGERLTEMKDILIIEKEYKR
ncbi:MAG: histidine phosphatase family protein [Oscillospiraceae bacterium]